jgi:hypothetical protein
MVTSVVGSAGSQRQTPNKKRVNGFVDFPDVFLEPQLICFSRSLLVTAQNPNLMLWCPFGLTIQFSTYIYIHLYTYTRNFNYCLWNPNVQKLTLSLLVYHGEVWRGILTRLGFSFIKLPGIFQLQQLASETREIGVETWLAGDYGNVGNVMMEMMINGINNW